MVNPVTCLMAQPIGCPFTGICQISGRSMQRGILIMSPTSRNHKASLIPLIPLEARIPHSEISSSDLQHSSLDEMEHSTDEYVYPPVSSEELDSIELRTISLSRASSPDPEIRRATYETFQKAVLEDGFLILVDHGLSSEQVCASSVGNGMALILLVILDTSTV